MCRGKTPDNGILNKKVIYYSCVWDVSRSSQQSRSGPRRKNKNHLSAYLFQYLFYFICHTIIKKIKEKREKKKWRGDLTETIGAYERLGLLELRVRCI